jgi:hypothetical protein
MVIAALLIVLALTAAGCGSDNDEQAAAPPPAQQQNGTDLTVVVDRDGESGPMQPREAQVQCDGAGGSAACAAAADLEPADFEPTPGDVACTQLYGGPETAQVTGTLRGEPIDATFSRSDGCEITRWDQVSKLLDAAG